MHTADRSPPTPLAKTLARVFLLSLAFLLASGVLIGTLTGGPAKSEVTTTSETDLSACEIEVTHLAAEVGRYAAAESAAKRRGEWGIWTTTEGKLWRQRLTSQPMYAAAENVYTGLGSLDLYCD